METVVTSTQNEIVRLFKKLELKKRRDEMSLFKIEGPKMLSEALLHKIPVEILLYDPERFADGEAIALVVSRGGRAVAAAGHVIESVCETKTPQGCAALCKMKDLSLSPSKIAADGVYLILENLQDPGNVGAIIRSANAFSAKGAVLAEDSCGAYAPKVVRAAAGALFTLDVFEHGDVAEVIGMFRGKGYAIAGTGFSKDAVLPQRAALQKTAIIIGNEGGGMSGKALGLCDFMIKIPMKEGAQSLNAAVAASIVLWESYKKLN